MLNANSVYTSSTKKVVRIDEIQYHEATHTCYITYTHILHKSNPKFGRMVTKTARDFASEYSTPKSSDWCGREVKIVGGIFVGRAGTIVEIDASRTDDFRTIKVYMRSTSCTDAHNKTYTCDIHAYVDFEEIELLPVVEKGEGI